MKIVGIGTDLIEVDRIANMVEKHGDLFLSRVYSKEEIRYCSARGAAAQHYAGRWAAKEAVLKVLGTGWAKSIKWNEISVVNEGSGRPVIELDGRAKEIAAQLGIDEMMISISHSRDHAIAYAMGIGHTNK